MDTLDPESRRRLDELMPWYVNGSIGLADREWVERTLGAHPGLRSELDWHHNLRARIREQFQDVPRSVGLDALMARVRAEAAGARPAARASWLRALREWMSGFAARPGFALALLLIVAQAGFIAALLPQAMHDSDHAQTRSLAPADLAAQGPVLQVMFKPETTERDMRLLLVSIAGRVIDGPGQLGEFIIVVPPDRIDDALRQLQASGLVHQAGVLERRPLRDQP